MENESKKLSEMCKTNIDQNEMVKDVVQKYATIIGCIVEFSNIKQALANQDSQNFTKLIGMINDANIETKEKRSLRSRQTSFASGAGTQPNTAKN